MALGGTRGSGGAAEVAVGEDAVPELAHECGAEKVRGLVRWDAEEDLLNELLRQLAPQAASEDGGTAAPPCRWVPFDPPV